MKITEPNNHYFGIYLLLIFLITACVYPVTTASYKWKIKWDKERLAFKKQFLNRELPEYSKSKLPNILLIVVDDLGKYEISAYGSQTVKTSNIDKLASEGVLFSDCYVNSPVCAPSRAGILSGRYPPRYGFETQPMENYPNNLAVYYMYKLFKTGDFVMDAKPRFPQEWQIQKQGLPPTEITLAELLKMRDYNTACIGKWHLGHAGRLIPNERGFDYQYGFYGAFSLYSEKRNSPNMINHIHDSFSARHQWKTGRSETSAIRRNDKRIKEDRYLTFAIMEEGIEYMARQRNSEKPFFLYLAFNAPHVPFQAPRAYYEMENRHKDENKKVYHAMIHALDDAIGIHDSFSARHQWKTGRSETSAIRRNDKRIKEDRYLTFAIMEEGIEYMARQRNSEKPFFLYLAFNAPHVPFQAPRAYYEMENRHKDENKKVYHAMIHALDDAIGILMEKMKALDLEENTLIFFISDNGGATYTGATDNGPYKGGKLTMFEGGVNVPFIMKWNGRIPEGVKYSHPVSSMDIFMTSAEAAECPLPGDRIYDGVNLLPYLTGKKQGVPHDVFYWKADHIEAMRRGNWKFLMSTRDKWIELYNIAEDKYEHYDLNDVHPDTLKVLRQEFDLWKNELKPPLWPRLMDHKFVIDGREYLFPA